MALPLMFDNVATNKNYAIELNNAFLAIFSYSAKFWDDINVLVNG